MMPIHHQLCKSGVFCRRNCCITFERCDGALSWIQSHCPDKADNIQAVRKSLTDQCNSSGQLLFSADQCKRHQFSTPRNSDAYHQLFSRIGISSSSAALVKCHSFDKLILGVCLLHPVFLSDALSNIIGVISNYSAVSALSNCQSNFA